MRTALGLDHLRVTPGVPTVVEIEVTNTTDVIDGITAEIDGLDPSWVYLPLPVVSLFPDSSATVAVVLNLPRTCLAGDYLVTARVLSTVDGTRTSAHQFWLTVEPVHDLAVQLRPSLVKGGTKGELNAFVANAGNVAVEVEVLADEKTKEVECLVVPPALIVAPGTIERARIGLRGPRPWFGQSVSRAITVTARAGDEELPVAGTFVQKPRIPRGVLTILILAGIIALWATIFLVIVDALRASAEPKKAVPTHFNEGGVTDVPLLAIAGSASGQVSAATTGEGIARITVEAHRQRPGGDTEIAAAVATGDDGSFVLPTLLPGPYTFRFSGDGYEAVWYPDAPDQGGAEVIEIEPAAPTALDPVVMGGQSATFIGAVLAPEGAGDLTIVVRVTRVVENPEEGEPPPEPVEQRTTGSIQIGGLAAPATYRFQIEAPGFETLEFEEQLEAGETKVLNTVRLGAALGSISGRTLDGNGNPLGGVTVTVSSGEFSKESVTPTVGDVGAYVIDGLETPQTYVVTFTAEGFATVSLALDLPAGQPRGGVDARLAGGQGALSGVVTNLSGAPLGGVKVTVVGGLFKGEAETLTAGAIGSYLVSGLPTPGTFTVTFAADGYLSETRLVTFAGPAPIGGIDAVLSPATAQITGTASTGSLPAPGVTIELSDGLTVRTTTSATAPTGAYSFTGVAPGTYTLRFRAPGHQTRILLLRVVAGDAVVRDVDLPATGP